MKLTLNSCIALLLLLITSCAKMDSIDFSKQDVLFQSEYINYAWGKAHNGYYIDSHGNVFAYNLPDRWNFPDSTFTLGGLSMNQNLSKCHFVLKLDQKVIAEKMNLLQQAMKGKLSNPETTMADAGELSKYYFIYNSQTKAYKQLLLSQWGDWTVKNSSKEANELSQWMDSVAVELYKVSH